MNSRVNIVSMGCSKNLVDSERLAARLKSNGLDVSFDSENYEGADIVINTCGFIGDAKAESIDMLLNAIELKKQGRVRSVYAMGCLSERYRNDLLAEMPELDGIFGKFDWDGLVDTLKSNTPKVAYKDWERQLSTSPHYTYLKIAEGCNRFCAFCAIPLITGRYKSRSIDDIAAEVAQLASEGVCEFNIIAQDLSAYGCDFAEYDSERSPLAELLERLSDIPGVEMLRLHYAYPTDFPFDILPVMAKRHNIAKYLDIALQHIDDTVLTNMRRHINSTETRALLNRIRKEIPGIHIRTTLMVGFPGEDDAAFEHLLDFVREQRFERMGAFAYCEEDDTYAARHFQDTIAEETKQERLDRLMAVQQEIAFEIAAAKVGSTMRVIIDSENDDFYIARSEFDSPDVDCNVLIHKTASLKPGNIVTVKIDSTADFDLIAYLEE